MDKEYVELLERDNARLEAKVERLTRELKMVSNGYVRFGKPANQIPDAYIFEWHKTYEVAKRNYES